MCRSWTPLTPGIGEHCLIDLRELDALRRSFHEHVHGLPDDHDGLPADPQRDEDRHDGVRVVPAGQIDDEAAQHDPQAGGGVAHEVQESAAQVEVVAVGAKQQGGDPVDDEARGGEGDDQEPLDGLG